MPTQRKSKQQFLAGFEEDPPHPERAGATVGAETQVGTDLPNLSDKTVYVVDAHALLYQVFHAMPEMSSPQGQPVNAVFGFVRDLFLLIDDYAPDYLFCAFDMPGLTFRHEIFEEYKEDREAMPDDLRPQIDSVHRMLKAMLIPALGLPSYEADDVMATLARLVEQAGGECVLVTSDKDCRQLISDRVQILNMRKGELFGVDALQATWGIRPSQVVDFQALVGDSIDNVPGVPLIGPKIASQLLNDFGTLEGVFANLHQVKGAKRQQNLREGQSQALISRQLVELVTNLEIDVDWEAGRVGPPDAERLSALCAEFGFRGFANRVADSIEIDTASEDWEATYDVLTSTEATKQLVERVIATQKVAMIPMYDPGAGSGHDTAGILGFAFAVEPGAASYVPLTSGNNERGTTLETLRPVFESVSAGKVGTHLKLLTTRLKRLGIELRGIEFDAGIASFLVEAGARNHSLDALSERLLKHRPRSLDDLLGTGKQRIAITNVDINELGAYAAERADICLRVQDPILRSLEAQGLGALYENIERPLIAVLAEIEFHGIRVDIERLGELSAEYGARLDALEEEIYKLAGREFNIGSPKQLSTVLFDELGLPVIKKTKTGVSTDIEVLEELALSHPLPAQIISFRQFAKLKNTYVDSLPMLVNPQTKRIHTSFNQSGAATGRLSSNDPNLQNIPVRTQEGREIRSAFKPGDDSSLLVTADYSQIELRVLAHYSGDATLLAAFANEEDIHTRVAAEVFETPLDQVTREMRRRAKAVNFGVIYGQSAFGLAKSLKIEKSEAGDFIKRYFERYASIGQFMTRVLDDCCRDGFVTTMLGRRRRIEGVRPPAKRGKQKNLAERTAINTVIQGTAADIIKKAMIEVHQRLRADLPEAKMLLQIHDELVFEVSKGKVDQLSSMVRQQMESTVELSTALRVDIKAGNNWAACELV